MYVLKNPIYELASSEFPIVYDKEQHAWLVAGKGWYADPENSFIVEEVTPPAPSLDGSPDVVG